MKRCDGERVIALACRDGRLLLLVGGSTVHSSHNHAGQGGTSDGEPGMQQLAQVWLRDFRRAACGEKVRLNDRQPAAFRPF